MATRGRPTRLDNTGDDPTPARARWCSAATTSRRSPTRCARSSSGRSRRAPGTSPSAVSSLLTGRAAAPCSATCSSPASASGATTSPVGWAFDITNFVFWVGIGHAGTLISAILFLFRQKWRTSINRFAEAMTIFAVICAGLFPAIHVGRAVAGLLAVPDPQPDGDVAELPHARCCGTCSRSARTSRCRCCSGTWAWCPTWRRCATARRHGSGRSSTACSAWAGAAPHRHWHRYERAYLLLAALATPLVLSVHSVVSFDFAASQLPGWHTTIFPPYFVAGAIFGGFAMVLTLVDPGPRSCFGLKDIITLAAPREHGQDHARDRA